MSKNIYSYHLYVSSDKWKTLMKNEDIRFFKHKKNLLNDLNACKETGITMKISSWNYMNLKNDYLLSNKIIHPNFVRQLCYFEYEDDIMKYLDASYDTGGYKSSENDITEECAVVIAPYYKSIMQYELNYTKDCVKQIILSLYTLFFHYNILLTDLSIDNIYIQNKTAKLEYELNDKKYHINTSHVVKIDSFASVECFKVSDKLKMYYLYGVIIDILKQFNKKYDIGYIISFIQDFQVADERLIHPLKVIDIILSQVDCDS